MTQPLFRNDAELATTPARRLVLNLAAAGLRALAPETLLARSLHFNRADQILEVEGFRHSISGGRLFVIGGGKAADVMATALENHLGSEIIAAGMVICKTQSMHPQKIQVREAGHPIPDARGVRAMLEIMALKDNHAIGEKDIVICLLSGGASALMPCPAPGITLEDKQNVTQLLLGCGAEISEINLIRKQLSLSKGGKLGLHFAPATVISLIVSDVIGNDLSAIGSGPTFPEKTRTRDAVDLLDRYALWQKVPENVKRFLESRKDSPLAEETSHCFNHIIGDSETALKAMQAEAARIGKRSLILSREVKGDPETAARKIAGDLLDEKYAGYEVLLAAGETTPVLPASAGTGGRNQQFALATLDALADLKGDWVHLSLASDGSDYLPDVAGAIVDQAVLDRAEKLGLSLREYLDRFDSYSFFKKTGSCLLETGPTGTNVGDLMIYVQRQAF